MAHLEGQAKLPPSESPTGQSWNGLPYRGKPFNAKNTDNNPLKQPRKKGIAHCKLFNMEDKEDVAQYTKVKQDCVNGTSMIHEREVLNQSSPFRIYLEWYDMMYVEPVEQ